MSRSYTYLKDYTYYSELYDRMTIEDCERWDGDVCDAYEKSGEKFDPERPRRTLYGGLVADLALYFKKGERYADKEETIRKWMDDARRKDEKVTNAIEPTGVRCLGCSHLMTSCISRDLMTGSNGKDVVLFMFECDRCHKRRAYWENGEEWEPNPVLCEKCGSEMRSDSVRRDDLVETTYSCPDCAFQKVDVFNLGVEKESVDPDFEVKRKKYCLSRDEGMEYLEQKRCMDSMKSLLDRETEKEQNKELYDAIARIRKLTVFELQSLLEPLLQRAGYVKFELGKPDLRKDVVIEFGLQDAKLGRSEYDSRRQLKKLFKDALEQTNWRLMSDGISYRLGFLEGRLRGVEGEENILNLISK